MNEGVFGVQLFYIISGLTLCMSWVAKSEMEKMPLRNFFIRRFFRIAPVFYFSIFCYLYGNGFAATFWAPNGIQWWFIPLSLTFTNGFNPETINAIVPGQWSIAVEACFYAIFPFLFLRLNNIQKCLLFIICCIFLSSTSEKIIDAIYPVLEAPRGTLHIIWDFKNLFFFNQLPIFIIGIALYHAINKFKDFESYGFIAVCLFLACFAEFFIPSQGLITHRFVAGFMFSLLTYILSHYPSVLIVNKLTLVLGRLSFGMYLIHFAVITILSQAIPLEYKGKSDSLSIFFYFVVVCITACLAKVAHELIEKPGIAYGKRLCEKNG
jgi:peptidoglycan/LPS O-acetylase OafA/YrhL